MVITPPNQVYSDDSKLLFLAGPIIGASQWQKAAIEHIEKANPNITIANPRREELKELTRDDWVVQVEWETSHLRLASAKGAIMFWLSAEDEHKCDNPFAKTTRFELAEWLTHYKYRKIHKPENKIKLILGVDDKFSGRDYIIYRVFDDCPEFVVATTLEETCQLAVAALK